MLILGGGLASQIVITLGDEETDVLAPARLLRAGRAEDEHGVRRVATVEAFVVDGGQGQLLEVVGALRPPRRLAGRLDHGQEEGDEDGDDRDDERSSMTVKPPPRNRDAGRTAVMDGHLRMGGADAPGYVRPPASGAPRPFPDRLSHLQFDRRLGVRQDLLDGRSTFLPAPLPCVGVHRLRMDEVLRSFMPL